MASTSRPRARPSRGIFVPAAGRPSRPLQTQQPPQLAAAASDVRPHLEWADGEWCSPDSMVLKVSIFFKKKEFPSSDESVKNHVLSVILCGSIVSVRNGDPWICLKTLGVGTDRDAWLEQFRS